MKSRKFTKGKSESRKLKNTKVQENPKVKIRNTKAQEVESNTDQKAMIRAPNIREGEAKQNSRREISERRDKRGRTMRKEYSHAHAHDR